MIKIKPKEGWATTFHAEDGNEVKLKDNFKAVECRDPTRKVLFIAHTVHCREQGGSYNLLKYRTILEDTLEEVTMYADKVSGEYCTEYCGEVLEYFVEDEWVIG